MVEVDLGQNLDLACLDQLVTALSSGRCAVFINTGRLEWVAPCGIATLLAYVRLLLGHGAQVAVSDFVLDQDVQSYLQRVDFYRVLGGPKEDSTKRTVPAGLWRRRGYRLWRRYR